MIDLETKPGNIDFDDNFGLPLDQYYLHQFSAYVALQFSWILSLLFVCYWCFLFLFFCSTTSAGVKNNKQFKDSLFLRNLMVLSPSDDFILLN